MATDLFYTAENGDRVMKVAGTIRNTGSGWFVVDDAQYDPSNLAIGTVTSNYIQVTYPGSLRVVSFLVGPDDTFAGAYTVCFGASVGLSQAVIRGRLNSGAFDPSTWANAQANIWIDGEFIVEAT
jgi:hypothetical protein